MTTTRNESTAAQVLPYDLTGRRVAVVGGKTGIGLGIAQAAHAAGASVVVAGRRAMPAGDHPQLAPFEQVEFDMGDEAAVRDAFAGIGIVDHLLVVAGPTDGSWGAFADEDMTRARRYADSKFFGSWACARYADLAADGSITFLTGGVAARSKLGMTAVTSAFAAVEALTRSLALELGPVRVNCIRPGFVETDLWNFLSDDDGAAIRERVRGTFPVRRLGRPADIGHAAVFLMTNPYVTGAILEVSGGEQLVDWQF